jgi:hypothetical protein
MRMEEMAVNSIVGGVREESQWKMKKNGWRFLHVK